MSHRPGPPRLALIVLAAALALGTACGKVKEEDWAEKSAEASCKFAKKCDTANFWFLYDDLDACIDDTLAVSEGLYDGCSYDQKAAKQCLKALDWSCKKIGDNYAELLATCEAVWDCGTGPGTGDTGGPPPGTIPVGL